MGKACNRIIEYIKESQEPFCNSPNENTKATNPWHSGPGDEGCCIIS